MKKLYLFLTLFFVLSFAMSAQEIHLIGLVDSVSSESIKGNAFVVSRLKALQNQFSEENIHAKLYLLDASDLENSEYLIQKLSQLQVSSNDVILCYNAAQGYYTVASSYPVLRFGKTANSDIQLGKLQDILLQKQARLTLIINEFSELTNDQRLSNTEKLERRIPRGYINRNAVQSLFMDSRGSLLIQSSKQGRQSIITEDNGGLFAQSFFNHLYESLFDEMASWDILLQNTVNETVKKSADFGEQQEPIYEGTVISGKSEKQIKTETAINVTSNSYKSDDFEIEIRTDRGVRDLTYYKCDTLHYWFKSSKPCFVRLIDVWADGRIVLLLNNFELTEEKVNQWIEIKGVNNQYFRCGPPYGNDYLLSFASMKKFSELPMVIDRGIHFLKESLENIMSSIRSSDNVILEDKLKIITKDAPNKACK